MGHWDEAASAFEENIQMMREINLSAANSEARLALAQAKMGRRQLRAKRQNGYVISKIRPIWRWPNCTLP